MLCVRLPLSLACLYISRFAIEAERQRRPEIAARLILIGDAKVHACSLGAKTSGVQTGMRMSEAIGLCPKAVVSPPDNAHCERRFGEVLELLDEVSPDVEPGEPGLAYVSLSGLSGDPQAIAERLISSLHKRTGFMASVGIAGNKFASRVAAVSSRPGIVKAVAEGEEAAFLAPFACTYLPASEAMLWRLKMLGIETIGDVAKLPIGPFQGQFGPEGKRCRELAQGIDIEPLVPRVVESSVVRRLQMPAPSVSLETILAGLERLTFAVYGDESRQGRWVRRAVARAALDGGGTWELPVAFREALADPKAAWFAIKSAVTRHPPERPVEELEVELIGLSGESGKQAMMFDGKAVLRRQIEEAARHLAANGGSSIGEIVEVEPWSRIPERRRAVQDLT
jgi:nucleotidyltransferase/DNA polymerase involved in DNA repair